MFITCLLFVTGTVLSDFHGLIHVILKISLWVRYIILVLQMSQLSEINFSRSASFKRQAIRLSDSVGCAPSSVLYCSHQDKRRQCLQPHLLPPPPSHPMLCSGWTTSVLGDGMLSCASQLWTYYFLFQNVFFLFFPSSCLLILQDDLAKHLSSEKPLLIPWRMLSP